MARFIIGTDKNDTVTGTSGRDIVIGDAGDDTIQTGAGRDIVRGGSGDDNIDGGSGADTIRGDSGDDTLSGGTGNDTLLGDAGADIISGGEGDDHIMGGVGNDTLTGGADSDVFIFVENSGNDTITDFDVDEDFIDLSMLDANIAFADLTITDLGDNSGVQITHSDLGTITLTGVSASELTAAHFRLPAVPPATSYDTGEGAKIARETDPTEGTEDRDFYLTSEDGTTDSRQGRRRPDIGRGGKRQDRRWRRRRHSLRGRRR